MKRFSGPVLIILVLSVLPLTAGDVTLLNPRFDESPSLDRAGTSYFFPFPLDLRDSFLTLEYRSGLSCRLILSDGTGKESYALPPLDGSSDLSRRYTLEEKPPFPVSSAELRDWRDRPVPFTLTLTGRDEYDYPAPEADHGTILYSDRPVEGDYLLYRWTEGDHILIFDFRDYDTQDLYLKRLAFFMEKPGFRGTLMTNEEMAGLHGWNAHDYSKEGLADFFNLARDTDFPLNREEEALRQILLNGGILIDGGETYLTGRGAIVSLTRETTPVLRERFITHESLHGIFFTDEEFRERIRKYWLSMPARYREIWRFFMVNNFYDPRDEVLMYNEMMGYTLQLHRKEVEDYFVWRFHRIGEIHPERRDYIDGVVPYLPQAMLKIYDDLSELVRLRYPYDNGAFQRAD